MYPYTRDVYVEEVWKVDADGKFIEKIPGSAGMLVSMDNCYLIELFRLTQEEPANAARTQAAGTPPQLASREDLLTDTD